MPEAPETPLAASAAILNAIKKDSEITFITALSGGRYVFELAVGRLETHEEIKKIRHQSPDQVNLLRESIKKTGDTPIYSVCVYVEIDAQQHLHFYVLDGSQRLRSLRELGLPRTTVIWVDRWTSVKAALEDALSLQFARYEMCDDDLISILETGKFSVKEASEKSGKSEATVLRLKKVAENPWVKPLIKDGVFGYAQFAKVIDACGGNIEKLTAVQNTMLTKHDAAIQKANHWKDKIAANPRRNWDKKSREKARVATYFGKAEVSALEKALKTTNAVVREDNKPMVNLQSDEGGTTAPWIGDDDDWREENAVYHFFARRAKDLTVEDYDEVLDDFDNIKKRLEVHRNRLAAEQAKANHPMPKTNPVEPVPLNERMQKQDAEMKTVSSLDDIK